MQSVVINSIASNFQTTMESRIQQALAYAQAKTNIRNIRPNQKKVIEIYLTGRDVLFCSPTGSGKSLTFELSPYLFKELEHETRATIIVVSPLVALMKKQTEKATSMGLRAVYLNDVLETPLVSNDDSLVSSIENVNLNDIRDGEADIIFTSPESILGHHRDLVCELEKEKHLKAIFIDEAHCISKFGTSSEKNKLPFRPAYGQLGELRSLTSVPVIALTATASMKTQEIIIDKLCMQKCDQIIVSPNKQNIKYWLCDAGNNITEDFAWLADSLLEQGKHTPRMIIFFRRTRQIGDLYEHLMNVLGTKAYDDYKSKGPNDDRNRLFDMFHSKTDDEVKESICSSFMDEQGTKRVVLVSTSFSMGLDVKGVQHVIHYGPANDIEDYMQETGRAGRDEDIPAHAILLKYKRCLSGRKSILSCMKQYCKVSSCRRIHLLQHFDVAPSSVTPLHACCDVCAQSCKCLCHCLGTCECTNVCYNSSSEIVDRIIAARDSSESNTDSSGGNTSTDSEVDQMKRRNIVLLYSSDSE